MEMMQAPNIEPGAKGRLVYDKSRRTIVGTQAPLPPHHLAQFGWRQPPHWLWRFSIRLYVIVSAAQDIWLILTGRATLHRAWQAGREEGTASEYRRTVIMGGR